MRGGATKIFIMLKFLFIFASVMQKNHPLKRLIKLKLVTAVFITASLAAFATLGHGNSKRFHAKNTSTSWRPSYNRSFSLRSNYNYTGNNILNNTTEGKFIMMNTVMTYQKGNATYILPLKKKFFLDKVNFNSSSRY